MMTTKYSTVNSSPSSRPLTLLHEQSKHTHLPIQTWVRSLHCGPWVANGVGGLCRKISWVAVDWVTFWESLDAEAVMRQLTVERWIFRSLLPRFWHPWQDISEMLSQAVGRVHCTDVTLLSIYFCGFSSISKNAIKHFLAGYLAESFRPFSRGYTQTNWLGVWLMLGLFTGGVMSEWYDGERQCWSAHRMNRPLAAAVIAMSLYSYTLHDTHSDFQWALELANHLSLPVTESYSLRVDLDE